MLKQNRSETDDLHRTIASKDAELIAERNVDDFNSTKSSFIYKSFSIVYKSKNNFVNNSIIKNI
jgi:hypothetical protein